MKVSIRTLLISLTTIAVTTIALTAGDADKLDVRPLNDKPPTRRSSSVTAGKAKWW